MKRLLPILVLLSLLRVQRAPAAPATGEYVILVGGPSLMQWEKYKGAAAHDHWWANFIRAARIRTEQIRAGRPRREGYVAGLWSGLQSASPTGKAGPVRPHRISA